MATETALIATRLGEARESGVLDLSGCKLVSLPACMSDFLRGSSITRCDISNNEIKTLPTELFQYIKGVKELNVANNQLGTLPDALTELTCLETLDVQHNNLAVLPLCVYWIDSLVTLKLQDNHIQYIDLEHLRLMRSLQNLHLEENPLEEDVVEALREYEEIHEDVFIRLS